MAQEQEHSKIRFFEPYVGKRYYKEGINGKKVLVLGASFYCDKDCKYRANCTDPVKRDSSSFDEICPEYNKDPNNRLKLSNEPSNVEGDQRAYNNFQKLIKDATGVEDMWESIAFTNYVQFFLPSYKTLKSYLTRRDKEAFDDTLIELKPDIVISWGVVTLDAIRKNNPYLVDYEKLPETEWYISHIEMKEVGHPITLLSVYHPSSSAWYTDYTKALKYLREALELIPQIDKTKIL